MIVRESTLDLDTPTGVMRNYVYSPFNPHRPEATYPGLVLYSEIFQQTMPIKRLAVQFAGRGFVVLVPEVFHEHEAPGVILGYDEVGREKGNRYKYATKLSTYDEDARLALEAVKSHPGCNGRLGTIGVCLGGHLAFRAAFHPEVSAVACFFPTDIHSSMLGEGQHDDSLARCQDIRGELMLVWGRQDPHIPYEGRVKIMQTLQESGVYFTWHELNAEHAFLRDEGIRYDPSHADLCVALAMDLFRRAL